MFLALKEMARAKARFGLLISAIGMLVFLILFQQSIQNGLITSFVGAIRNQSAPVLVYSVDGQQVIQGSVITPDLEGLIRETDGVGSAARVGLGTFTVRAGGELSDATILGYEEAGLGAPSSLVGGRYPAGAREAVGSDSDAPDGFGIGDVVVVEPGGQEITIVGLARDVIAVAPAEGLSAAELAARINEVSDDLDALTRSDAASETPGVAQVQQSFRIVFFLYGLVIPCVTGLFFLIVTFQKAGSFTLLRALGAPASRLVASLLFQATLIVGVGFLVGVAAYTPISQRRLGGIPLRFETTAVVVWAVLLLALGVGSSLIAARRVLRIDPIDATTGGGVR